MPLVLAPDVLVNASVALGEAPQRVVDRLLTLGAGETAVSGWVLERTEAMLRAVPTFKADAVGPHVAHISSLVTLVTPSETYGPDAWQDALVATAKAAGADRVLTDHPDLLETGFVDGIEFMACEAFLVEATMPPPPPTKTP